MTKKEAITKLLRWLAAQVGYREGANNYNKYAPIAQPLVGWDCQYQPWCDIFTDAAFIVCFGLQNAAKMTYQQIGRGSAKCSTSADFFKRNGAFFDRPEVGDVVFFVVDGDINHQGIVVDIDEQGFETIEGNCNDRVERNRYSNGFPRVAGFGRPAWSVVADVREDAPLEDLKDDEIVACQIAAPVLARGDKGNAVKAMQGALIALGFGCGPDGADGDFGGNTEAAVKRYQAAKGLDADGICGPKTWTKLIGG